MTLAPLLDDHDVVLVSDLHMGAGNDDPFVADEAFVALLGHLEARHAQATRPLRIVLLGDFLDFTVVEVAGRRLDPSVAGALARLERIAAAHESVFAALARVAAAGVPLHVVPGNHDLELLSSDVLAHLVALVSPGGGTVVLHPWMVHVEGVLYAEHGHQHHDINRVVGLLDAYADPRGYRPPAGTVFGEFVIELADALGRRDGPAPGPGAIWRALRARPSRLPAAAAAGARLAGRLTRATAQMSRDARPGRRARQQALARAHSAPAGLPESAVAALAHVSATSPLAVARRLLRRDGTEYMLRAAGEVDVALTAAGVAVPSLVFGHTHVAADRALGSAARAPHYLNPGTWSELAAPGTERFGFVEVTQEADGPVARLRHWDASAGAVRPLSPDGRPTP